jgi:DNA repair exonuclease SbcCD nuclease subunit
MDREIRILHTADTHLGYKQYHNEFRRKDFFAAFEQVINDALEMQVDAVVHAGDLFDSRNPTLEDLLETINILSRLKTAGIPFFGIVGNHESKQNTQWLDLFEEMGLAARLGNKPRIIENIAVYGIDSVPRSKISSYDYSNFEVPDPALFSRPEDFENYKNILVMHQIVQPFPYAEWDCAVVLENLPFKVDAILLGDYHKYEKFPVGEAWATYPGSTERNSVSEADARTYNIVTFSADRVEISRRPISTRRFVSIPVNLNGEENPHEQAFSKINERLEELPEAVVFLEISGDSKAVLSMSEIEEYLLKKEALVVNFNDKRTKEVLSDEGLTVTFSDPDHAVADEIKRMSLNDGGLIVDEIIRSLNVPKSRVDEETENRLLKLVKAIDFKNPDFRGEAFSNSARLSQPPNQVVDLPPETSRTGPEAPELEPSELISPPEVEVTSQSGLEPSQKAPSEPESQEKFDLISEPVQTPVQIPVSRPISRSVSKSVSQLQSSVESDIPSPPEPSSELSPESNSGPVTNPAIQVVPSEKLTREPEDSANEIEAFEASENTELKEEKPLKPIETPEKKMKTGPKKGKGKVVAPRQFNLGDYL